MLTKEASRSVYKIQILRFTQDDKITPLHSSLIHSENLYYRCQDYDTNTK